MLDAGPVMLMTITLGVVGCAGSELPHDADISTSEVNAVTRQRRRIFSLLQDT
jgi:hypothetical protein